MVTIYALKDNGIIFYIGQTISIKDRMYQHKAERHLNKTNKQKRIKNIFDNGRELTYEILETCETEQGLIIENNYIKIYLLQGVNLVNKNVTNNNTKLRKPIDKIITRKERQILQLMADDNNTKGIAKATGMSTRTIEQLRNRIKRKANVKSIAALMRYAYINRLIV